MAASRLEKIGTIFSRASGLIRSGALKWEDRPLWYDVYELAFPLKEEPRYDRPVPDMGLRKILYEEDRIRAERGYDRLHVRTVPVCPRAVLPLSRTIPILLLWPHVTFRATFKSLKPLQHIVIKAPPKSGSDYFNYKKYHSIILLALVDHDYCFTYVDIGAKGRASDGGVFANSSLFEALEQNLLDTPQDAVIVGDDAFPLKPYLLKPYSKRNLTREEKIFNYRLLRARRISENAFGILVSKFQVFKKPIELKPDKVDKIVMASCSLHNWLRKTNNAYINPGLVDEEDLNYFPVPGSWRTAQSVGLLPIQEKSQNRNPTRVASQKRDQFCSYFNGEGAVSWQWRMIE